VGYIATELLIGIVVSTAEAFQKKSTARDWNHKWRMKEENDPEGSCFV